VITETTRYSDTHLRFTLRGSEVVVGITDRIAGALTLVQAIFLPEPSSRIAAGQQLVSIDAQKAVFDIEAPVDLDVLTVNEELNADPLLVRLEPRGRGWLLTARLAPNGWGLLLDEDAYIEVVERERAGARGENLRGETN
jgi:glycine cleavage system H protein